MKEYFVIVANIQEPDPVNAPAVRHRDIDISGPMDEYPKNIVIAKALADYGSQKESGIEVRYAQVDKRYRPEEETEAQAAESQGTAEAKS